MKRQAKIELFLSDARGIYIPRDFAQCVNRDRISGVDMADLDYLAAGPERESYWDAWADVEQNAVLTGDDGTKYRIHQDGDCWLVEEAAEYDEDSDWDLGYFVDDGIAPELDAFTQGYIECALWSESAGIAVADDGTVTEDPDNDMSFAQHNFDVGDIAPESLARIVEECAAFQKENARLLEIATRQRPNFTDDSQHGHDFWLTRNGHGAGFWDRGYRFGVGEALTKAAKSAGSSDLYYSDGAIHAS